MNTKVIFRPIIIRVHNHVNQSDAEAVLLLSYPAKQVFPCKRVEKQKPTTTTTKWKQLLHKLLLLQRAGNICGRTRLSLIFLRLVEKVAGEFKANQGITFEAPLKTAL